jgi:hypothetical protein
VGLTLEFLAGDSRRLIAAFKEVDLDALYEEPACLVRADFSLHLIPADLDLLSEAIGEAIGSSPIQLAPFLASIVDEIDGGALEVGKKWVSYIAGCDVSMAQSVSKRWTEKMKQAHPDEEIELTPEMSKAVESLIVLCKKALTESYDVIHIWFG